MFYSGTPFNSLTQNVSVAIDLPFPTVECSVFNLTGLEEYNNYTFAVKAVNSAGASELSQSVAAQTFQAGKYQ